MWQYPHLNSIAFSLGPVVIHWYGLMYLLGFVSAWILGNYRARKMPNFLDSEQVSDAIFYGSLGVIVGGRLGYLLFYDFLDFVHQPWLFFEVWLGGMSFHGGFLGVLISLCVYARRQKLSYLRLMDFIAPLVPIGLGAGRLGNFINGELFGRVTNSRFGMIFPTDPLSLPRYPSQLIEFTLEGILLFIILWTFSSRPRPTGAVSGIFLITYGCFRCVAEFFREPDPQRGYLAGGWLTEGQLLSLPMILLGLGLCIWAYRRRG